MIYIRCNDCKGTKKRFGLGLIEETCSTCEGVGHVEKKETEEEKRARERMYTNTKFDVLKAKALASKVEIDRIGDQEC